MDTHTEGRTGTNGKDRKEETERRGKQERYDRLLGLHPLPFSASEL
jgi:hypothetical protein